MMIHKIQTMSRRLDFFFFLLLASLSFIFKQVKNQNTQFLPFIIERRANARTHTHTHTPGATRRQCIRRQKPIANIILMFVVLYFYFFTAIKILLLRHFNSNIFRTRRFAGKVRRAAEPTSRIAFQWWSPFSIVWQRKRTSSYFFLLVLLFLFFVFVLILMKWMSRAREKWWLPRD